MRCTATCVIGLAGVIAACGPSADPPQVEEGLAPMSPAFEAVQPDLFAAPGAQPNAWADVDGDGDLDLFVGFRGAPDRLYRNDGGRFTDVAPEVGLADAHDTRAAAWGDYDADGDVDLFVGSPAAESWPTRLYRNEGQGQRFVDVAPGLGLALPGTTRQVSWVDYDGDGDLDLFVAFRDAVNHLFRNDGGTFRDVTEETGIGDPRRTVGVVWFDLDEDGDLDAFVANQNGDHDGVYRQEGGRFTDVAAALGMDDESRPPENGGVGPAVVDFDNDGHLDLFVANYGPNALYRSRGDGTFENVARAYGVDGGDAHATTAVWGDLDNDGWPDLFVAAYLAGERLVPDFLFMRRGARFVDELTADLRANDASHGVQIVDYDGDGALDLAVANNHPEGQHPLFRNRLPAERARASIQVSVRDAAGRATKAGAEVRVYEAGTRRLLGARLVDTGGGYCSQSVAPVHVGLGTVRRVDVEVTSLSGGRRVVTRVADVDAGPLTVSVP